MNRKALTVLTAAVLSASALPATAGTLLDYRDMAFLSGSPFYSAAERARIAAALVEAPGDIASRFGDDFAVLGDAAGALTEPGVEEQIYLVQAGPAIAIEPFPEAAPPLLVVLRNGEAAGFHSLAGDVQYQRLVAVADIDGDGRDEAFLETSSMNMGQTTMSLDIISLGSGESAEIVETLREVYYDGCDNPVGARERKASTISIGDGVRSESFEEACPQ